MIPAFALWYESPNLAQGLRFAACIDVLAEGRDLHGVLQIEGTLQEVKVCFGLIIERLLPFATKPFSNKMEIPAAFVGAVIGALTPNFALCASYCLKLCLPHHMF
jgi:hypothetical protein